MLDFELLDPRMTQEHLGLIPDFLSLADPRSAVEQINECYAFGGFRPFRGFTLQPDNSLKYPGDPVLKPLAQAQLRHELVVFYCHAWVAVIQPDRSFVVARID